MIEKSIEVLDFPCMEKDTAQRDAIRRHYLFSGLEESVFDELATSIAVETFEKGATLFHRGDEANNFYLVESGQIELSVISADGQKKVIEVVSHDRTFAEAVLIPSALAMSG